VDALHEGVEVDAPLGLHLKVRKKQIHQHGFAAAHVTVDINTLRRAILAQEFPDGPALFAGFKGLSEAAQLGNDGSLCGIVTEFSAGYFFGMASGSMINQVLQKMRTAMV
jgi:hypothetical protein